MKDLDNDFSERQETDAEISAESGFGTLYVISTPIGNLEDITLRALRILKDVETIAAENSTHTRGLCEHYGIKTKLTSYHQHNQKAKARQLLKKLKSGRNIALVTDAGTPGISDPGAYLINEAAKEGINVTPVPGPSAVITALSVSGLPTEAFVFLGFLPNKPNKRKNVLKQLIAEPRTMVFFEAPHRIKEMLEDLRDILGDRHMVMLREMTKVFEEVRRGPVSSVLEHLDLEKTRGEFTLVVAGNKAEEQGLNEEVLERMEKLLCDRKMGVRDISQFLAQELRLPYRLVYKECLKIKRHLDSQKHMQEVKKLKITNSLGLHARAAAKIVELAGRYNSRLFLKKDGQEVDGSNILSILTLSCPKGTEVQAKIIGKDSENFMKDLTALFEAKFGEGK